MSAERVDDAPAIAVASQFSELLRRLRNISRHLGVHGVAGGSVEEAASMIEQLDAERDALNAQLDDCMRSRAALVDKMAQLEVQLRHMRQLLSDEQRARREDACEASVALRDATDLAGDNCRKLIAARACIAEMAEILERHKEQL